MIVVQSPLVAWGQKLGESGAGTAAESQTEGRRLKAKQRFVRGLSHVENGNWEAALADFLASRRLYPTRVSIENAAISLHELGRHAEALAMYQELLARFGDTLTGSDRRGIEQSIRALDAQVGKIMVTSSQPSSQVVVDGQQRALTPLAAPVVVDAGTHTVRVVKDGYEGVQQQILVATGQTRTVNAKLEALQAAGTLVVREQHGRTLDVVVDGATVGKTPVFRGRVAAGKRTVLLRGPNDLGTPPATVDVGAGKTATLTLRANVLDAEILIEPTPSNATVYVDDVEVGDGVWKGRLSSGNHVIRVAASGFTPVRRKTNLQRQRRRLLEIVLERDLSSPMWRVGFAPHIYLEGAGGLFWSSTFGGGADSACGRGECGDRSRPFGFMVGARGGYQLTRQLGLELFLGFVTAKESMTRTTTANVEGRTFVSRDYTDKSRVAGAIVASSASYRFFERTPLTVRVWAGAARVNSISTNGGTFSGVVENPQHPGDTVTVTQRVSIPEASNNVWLPFVGPEARIGVRLSERFSVDAGVAAWLMFGPDSARSGSNRLSSAAGKGARNAALSEIPGGFADGTDVRPGVLALPKESSFGTFIALLPSVGARFDF